MADRRPAKKATAKKATAKKATARRFLREEATLSPVTTLGECFWVGGSGASVLATRQTLVVASALSRQGHERGLPLDRSLCAMSEELTVSGRSSA
jgi:hypothetical protein